MHMIGQLSLRKFGVDLCPSGYPIREEDKRTKLEPLLGNIKRDKHTETEAGCKAHTVPRIKEPFIHNRLDHAMVREHHRIPASLNWREPRSNEVQPPFLRVKKQEANEGRWLTPGDTEVSCRMSFDQILGIQGQQCFHLPSQN